ncbi:MAG: EutN/CcmL family microcompartment protein [Dorea sp.]|nr:EutN/CcmL family microcompartment protein [Dorea sp.]
MVIAKVVGNIVSTQKHDDYKGQKLLIVRAVDLNGELYGSEMVVCDGADAGVGDYVLIIQEGGSARLAARCDHLGPIDRTVIAIIDRIHTTEGSLP